MRRQVEGEGDDLEMQRNYIHLFLTWVCGLAIVVIFIIAAFAFSFYINSDEVKVREDQCSNLMQSTDDNISIPTIASTLCLYTSIFPGERYQDRLPNPQINITVKTIQILWLGDCKVMTQKGEVYHASDDQICMAQPGDNLTVYQYRTRDNTVTDYLVVG